jgi:E3 ubiquitin-protein ligase HECTD1
LQILSWASVVLNAHAECKSVLEVQFVDEEGTGVGPSLEFYALLAAEFQRKDLGMWLCDDDNEHGDDLSREIDIGAGVKPPGYYVQRSGGLFPAPVPQNSSKLKEICILYELFGMFLAKCLQDGRRVDIPLSNSFLKLMCFDRSEITQTVPRLLSDVAIENSMKESRFKRTGNTNESILPEDDKEQLAINNEEEISLKDTSKEVLLKDLPAVDNIITQSAWFSDVLDIRDVSYVDPYRGKFLLSLDDFVKKKREILDDGVLSEEEKLQACNDLSFDGNTRLSELMLAHI